MSHDEPFARFFAAVTGGRQPFEWQADLAACLSAGDVPERIDVPTGFGKTSLLHCWAYALGQGADLPRRLAFVVDRRLIVDATFEQALRLAAVLRDAIVADDAASDVASVASSLAGLHGDPTLPPLEVVRMRGGTTWESRWLARPDQAAIVTGTVDQFGSRLLFRGYGASHGMRPIDAALVGTDTWLVIDEAHIAAPLLRTARSVSGYQQIAERPLGTPLRVTEMSATLAGGGGFVADADAQATSDRFPDAARAARKRLDATKPSWLVDVADLATGSARAWRRDSGRLGQALAELAWRSTADAEVVGVIANTISTARAAHARLVQLAGPAADVALMIGRCRAYERDLLLARDLQPFAVGAPPADDSRRRFLVATQTVEVGADLDFDALVTELAPLPALIQRFGRLNRVGERAERPSFIVRAGFTHDEEDGDPVYGMATAATWNFLQQHAVPRLATRKELRHVLEVDERDSLPFGLQAARALVEAREAEIGRNSLDGDTREAFVPTLLGSHLERWAASNPTPIPDQTVGPFLHGATAALPEVFVAWRTPPPLAHELAADDPERITLWNQWLQWAPPTSYEFVSVPVWELHALLADRASQVPTADLESAVVHDVPEAEPVADLVLLGVRLSASGGGPAPVRKPTDVRPGQRVVLDHAVGGHDRWGWTGRRREEAEDPVADVADLDPHRRRHLIRPTPDVLGSLGVPPIDGVVARVLPDTPAPDEYPPEQAATIVRELTTGLLAGWQAPGQRLGAVELSPPWPVDGSWSARWRTLTVGETGDAAGTNGAFARVLLLMEEQKAGIDLAHVDDDDVAASSQALRPLGLDQHGDEVGALAEEFARHLELDADLARTVALAGRLHDVGKVDSRFQLMLYDGEAMDVGQGLRAKSGRDWRDPIARRARQLSGLPRGFRHEAVSARLVQALVDTVPPWTSEVDVELLRHLVASHHGHARPLLPAIEDPAAQTVTATVDGVSLTIGPVSQVDWSHPAVFERLNHRYGWWGLALLESLVRLADIRCSEVAR